MTPNWDTIIYCNLYVSHMTPKMMSKQVSIRLSDSDAKLIAECVNAGYAVNGADFIRTAIREKIARCGV